MIKAIERSGERAVCIYACQHVSALGGNIYFLLWPLMIQFYITIILITAFGGFAQDTTSCQNLLVPSSSFEWSSLSRYSEDNPTWTSVGFSSSNTIGANLFFSVGFFASIFSHMINGSCLFPVDFFYFGSKYLRK